MVTKFTDEQGNEWCVKITVPVIRRVCEELDLTIGKIQRLEFPPTAAVDIIWFAVQEQAGERNVSRAAFEDAVGLVGISRAIQAVMQAIGQAFPEAGAAARRAMRGPFESGRTETSSSSPPSQESVLAKS